MSRLALNLGELERHSERSVNLESRLTEFEEQVVSRVMAQVCARDTIAEREAHDH